MRRMGRHALATSDFGEVAEWSNAPDSKSGLRFRRNVGSNPTLSANLCNNIIYNQYLSNINITSTIKLAIKLAPISSHFLWRNRADSADANVVEKYPFHPVHRFLNSCAL